MNTFYYYVTDPNGAVTLGPQGLRFIPWANHVRALKQRGTSHHDEARAGRVIHVDHVEYAPVSESGLGEDHLGRSILRLDLLSLTLLVAQAMRDGMSKNQIERLIPNPCLHFAADDATRAIEALIDGSPPSDVFAGEIDTRLKAIRPSKRDSDNSPGVTDGP